MNLIILLTEALRKPKINVQNATIILYQEYMFVSELYLTELTLRLGDWVGW